MATGTLRTSLTACLLAALTTPVTWFVFFVLQHRFSVLTVVQGNVQTYENGIAWYNYVNPEYTSIESLLGRAVILHALYDHGAGYGCDQVIPTI